MKLDHHAYIIEGFGGRYTKLFLDFFASILNIDEGSGKSANSSPNFLHIKNNQLDIDDARKIVEFNSQKSFGVALGKKVIFIEMNGAGHQAQNALLKTLEEPSPNTYFFIVIPKVSLLLPTIKSRVQIYEVEDFLKKMMGEFVLDGLGSGGGGGMVDGAGVAGGTNKINNLSEGLALKFLQSKPALRIEMIKNLIEDDKKDVENDNLSVLFEFLNDLEITIHKSAEEKLKRRLSRAELSALVLVREYFGDAGASKKMLLEYLAVELPVI